MYFVGKGEELDDVIFEGGLSAKEVVAKWIDWIIDEKADAVRSYYDPYFRQNGLPSHDWEYNLLDTYRYFESIQLLEDKIKDLLLDMININLETIEDAIIAIYGVMSREVCIYRNFDFLWNKGVENKKLFLKQNPDDASLLQHQIAFDPDFMWWGTSDDRLAKFLGIENKNTNKN